MNKTPEEQIQELEKKEKLSFLDRLKYKRLIKIQLKAIKRVKEIAERDKAEEERMRETMIIPSLMEVTKILTIEDEETGKEMETKEQFQQKTTEWLIETWEGATNEIMKIVGEKDHKDDIDFTKEGLTK